MAQIRPSTVLLTWTKPEGKSSFFRIQVTDGKNNLTLDTNETFVTITNLTAGVKHNITVCAVAEDGHTEGEKLTYLLFTSKYPFNFGLNCKTAVLFMSNPYSRGFM